jgi:hypothetical protein
LAEEHWNDMELEFVEDAGGECELRRSGAVNQHVLITRSLLGPRHPGPDVGHVGDQRPLRRIDSRLLAAEDEDRHAVVVVTAPAARRLERPPAGDDRPCGHELIDDLAVDARRTGGSSLVVGVGIRHEPLVQAVSAVAEPVAGSFVWPGDEPVEGHGHVENGGGHGISLPRSSATCDRRRREK